MGQLDIGTISSVVAWILIGFGVIAIFLPFGPSIPLIWLGIFVYAFGHQWMTITQTFMALVTGIALFTIFLDYTLYRFGIRKFRAGAWGVIGAIVGFIVGSFINPIVQFVVGPVFGAIAFESLRGRDQVFSFKAGNTTVVAFMGGTIVKLAAAVAIIGLFILRLRGSV